MRCPNCQELMEREDAYRMAHDLHGKLIQQTPSADYLCPNCGSEYEWIQGRKRLVHQFDSATQEYDSKARY